MMELIDVTDNSLKKFKGNIAELTRPGRGIKKKMRAEKRKPQGRKKKNDSRPAKYHNWLTPFCWTQISIVAKQVGWRMSASAIADGLKKRDSVTFAKITRTTINGWIDRSGDMPQWKESILRRVKTGNSPGHNKGGCRGILSLYPEIVETIKSRLQFLRQRNAPITLITARAMIVATILQMNPSIFDQKFKDGSSFRVSDSFVRNFLHSVLAWSLRKATQAAQKLPKDWQNQCLHSFFRKAYVIKDRDIPIYLVVNFDQTQVTLAPGNRMSWAETGSKQVGMVGMDEKRAFTLVVGVSADGTLLPFQTIFVGKTATSLPSATTSPNYSDAVKAGFKFEPSGTGTYWSNQSTMRSYINDIITPYFDKKNAENGLPAFQCSLLQLDVWSVHRSEEFRGWMSTHHPTIILDYVPGGCTGIHQPCDVGIQRPLKLSIKKSYHEDIVQDLMLQAKNGNSSPMLKEGIKDLRDRTPRWLWNAYNALNNKELIQKVS
jgi:hypothetical protein